MGAPPGSDIERPLCVVFSHLLNRYLLSSYYAPRAEKGAGSKTDQPRELSSVSEWKVKRQLVGGGVA